MTRNASVLTVASLAALTLASAQASADEWQGFSVGIGGGYGMTKNDLNIGSAPTIPDVNANVGINGLGGDGGFLTLSAGYDHRFFGPWIIGAFIDYDFSDIDTHLGVDSRIAAFNFSTDFQIENQLSVGGRLGYLVAPSTLFFSTFGYAHAETSNLTANISLGSQSGGGTLGSVGSFNGYFLGGGVETMISNGFSLKAEYRYTSLQAETLDISQESGLSEVITGSIKPQIQTGRISLNYRFGDGKTEAPDNSIPPITSSWTSPYFGVGAGYGIANNDLNLSDRPTQGSIFDVGIPLGHDGGFLSATVGYDYQISPRFVIGAFGDADYSHLRQGNSLSLSLGDLDINGGTSTEFKNLLMVGGRLGYLMWPDTMLFVSGGYANVEADATHLSGGASFDGVPLGGISGTLIGDKNLSGGFIGGGIETRLTDTLSLKAEYRYIDLGKESVTLLPYDLPEINQLVSTTFDPDIQMGRLSINYRFGGPSSTEAVPLK